MEQRPINEEEWVKNTRIICTKEHMLKCWLDSGIMNSFSFSS